MARVLHGEYESTRLEQPGLEGQGVKFRLRRGAAREYHQVKRRRARSGHWTLWELNVTGILPVVGGARGGAHLALYRTDPDVPQFSPLS